MKKRKIVKILAFILTAAAVFGFIVPFVYAETVIPNLFGIAYTINEIIIGLIGLILDCFVIADWVEPAVLDD